MANRRLFFQLLTSQNCTLVIATSFSIRILEKLKRNSRRGLRKIEDNNTLVFNVDICTDKKKIKDRP